MSGLIGRVGTVTVATRGSEGPGEVELETEGGTQALIAYSEHPLDRHTSVVVYNDRGGMRVEVEPLNAT